MNRMTFVGRVTRLLAIAAAMATGVVPAVSQSAHAGSSAECVTANVTSPFRLPNGQLYPAGSLTLCEYGTFSPVETLHRVFVGGSSVGMFRSHRRSAESGSIASPELVFHREAGGNLKLIGYAMPSARGVLAYRMNVKDETLQASTPSSSGMSAGPLAAVVATARGR